MTGQTGHPAGPAGQARTVLSVVSLAAILAASLSFAVLTGNIPPIPGDSVSGPAGREMMKIDGNRNGDTVEFSHLKHAGYAGSGGSACRSCHHLAMPGEDESSCARCHRYMDAPSSMFDHDGHIARERKRASCAGCHRGDTSRRNIVSCGKCHEAYTGSIDEYRAVSGYRDALHGLCRRCHEDSFAGTRAKGGCRFCHR